MSYHTGPKELLEKNHHTKRRHRQLLSVLKRGLGQTLSFFPLRMRPMNGQLAFIERIFILMGNTTQVRISVCQNKL